MKKLSIIVTVLLLLAVSAPSLFAVSEAGVIFLLIAPTARVGGMGEAFVALADDASASYWNPAGLAFQQGTQATGMYSRWLPQFNLDDLYLIFLAGRHSIEGLGTVAGHITYLNEGEQIRTDETGPDELGRFNSNEYAIAVSYGTLLSETFGVGIGVKYIRSNLADFGQGAEKGSGQSSAFAIDLGILKKNFFIDRLNLGVAVSNIGPKITFVDADQADPLPTNLKFGFAYRAIDQEFNKLTLLADVNKLLVNRNEDGTTDSVMKAFITSWENNDIIYNVGAEYWYANLIALRLGYNYDDAGNSKYLTVGAGLKYAIYQFDFGYIAGGDNNPLSDTMRFSLTVGN